MEVIVSYLHQRCEYGTENQLLRSSARIGRALEDKFLQFLPSILQYILSIASEVVHVSVTVST